MILIITLTNILIGENIRKSYNIINQIFEFNKNKHYYKIFEQIIQNNFTSR